jgi:carboxymethylenebutenolidase
MRTKSRWLDLPSENGRMAVFVAEPEEPGVYPGMVYFHVVLGINDQHRSIVERLASEGYVVAMPDLYHRISYRAEFSWPEQREEAFKAAGARTYYGIAADSRLALNLLREMPNVDAQRLGAIGFCGGGTVAFLAGCFNSDIRAVVDMYGSNLASMETTSGRPTPPLQLAAALQAPVLSISGGADQNPSPADIKVAAATFERMSKPFEHHIWEGDPPAGHAFFDADIPDFSNPKAVEWAWPIMLDFLKRTLQNAPVTSASGG